MLEDNGPAIKAYGKEIAPEVDWVSLADFQRLQDAARAKIVELEDKIQALMASKPSQPG